MGSAGVTGALGGADATEVSPPVSVSSLAMVTVCAVTVDSGLDVSVSSSLVDGVDESVPEVSSSDAGSSSPSSLAADDELLVADELDGGAEFVPADSDFAEADSDEDSEELDWPSSAAAIPGLLAIAAPIPSATAKPPTLPMKRP